MGQLPSARLRLLGGFALSIDEVHQSLPVHARRVLAYLSVARSGRPEHSRDTLAERLWPTSTNVRAKAMLRTILWRIRKTNPWLVTVERDSVRLAEAVRVDVDDSIAQAARLVSGAELEATDINVATLIGDLLPGWEEDWLLLERERIQQAMIRGLEALGRRMVEAGRYFEAVDAAYAAIAAEPLRETAHEIIIDVHLAERNLAGARRQFATLDSVLSAELGIHPSSALAAKVR